MGGPCWGEQGVPPSLCPWDREASSLCCPVRPVEVTGASSSATGKLDGYADSLTSGPSTCPCGLMRFPMGRL